MTDSIRARSLSEILDGTFKLYRDHAGVLLAISVPSGLVTGLSSFLIHHGKEFDASKFLGILLPLFFLGAFAYISQLGALFAATTDAYLGRPFSIGSAYARSFSRFGALCWALFLFGVGCGVGLILLVVPGIYLALRWALWTPALMVEEIGGVESLSRSAKLVQGSMGRLSLLLLAFTILQFAIDRGLSAALPSALAEIPWFGAAAATLPAILLAPLYPALITIFYFDGRIRHEAFDLELRAQALPAAVTPP